MRKKLLQTLLISFFLFSLHAQNLDVEGKAKISMMDTATTLAQPVAVEPDGTLSKMSIPPTTYSIGDFVQGGVVFWVSTSGDHYKVVSIYDVETFVWSFPSNTGTGLGAQSDINGAGNTVAISQNVNYDYAVATYCDGLAYSGYDDWYLPSKDELNEVYTNRAAINTTATANGGETFKSSTYWSSTEVSTTNAWRQNFNTGAQDSANKSTAGYIRAIRSFSYP